MKSENADRVSGQVERIVRILPSQNKRVETGKTQFGDDWPGVFIRGDNAARYSFEIYVLLNDIERGKIPSEIQISALRGLAKLLESAKL